MSAPLASWSLDEVMRRVYGEHRRWRPSCLTVEMPTHKIGGNSGRAGWEDQGKPQRLTFSGLCRSWAEVGLHTGAVPGAGDAALTKSCCVPNGPSLSWC